MQKQTGNKSVSTRFLMLLVAATLGAALLQARAQTSAPSPARMEVFSALDVNQDGFVDKQEAAASAAISKAFEAADTNKDGRLSPQEYAKIQPAPRP